jgi:hypothetical protein
MGLSTSTFGWLRDGIGNLAAAREIESKLNVAPSGNQWFVTKTGADGGSHDGKSWGQALASWQAAHDLASAGDTIYGAPGEYNEDVIVTKAQVSLIGVGPRHSIRITASSAGATKTPMTVDGVSEVGLYNLNLAPRSTGDGLLLTGNMRRFEAVGCKIGDGGTNAVHIANGVGDAANTVFDIRLVDNLINNCTNGLNVTFEGGSNPGGQYYVARNRFAKIATDCIVQGGFVNDWEIAYNVFSAVSGTEPTRFLDIDDTSTTGLVVGNKFHTTVFSTAKFAIATNVFFCDNKTQAEGSSSTATGTASGRPN